MSGGEDDSATAELVAFHVEGTAYYLVPLFLLDRFVVTERPGRAARGPLARLGWGTRVPEVAWNSFHHSQVGLLVDLAPGVTAQLGPHHFDHPARRPPLAPRSPEPNR